MEYTVEVEEALSYGVSDFLFLLHINGTNNWEVEVIVCDYMVLLKLYMCVFWGLYKYFLL